MKNIQLLQSTNKISRYGSLRHFRIWKLLQSNRRGSAILACSLALGATACGCIFNSSSAPESSPIAQPVPSPSVNLATPPIPKPSKVQKTWQDQALSDLEKMAGGTEALLLFSEGGWSDIGQFMVFVAPPPGAGGTAPSMRFEYIEPSAKIISETRILTATEASAFMKSIQESSGLPDYEKTAFDGLNFEFVRARRTLGPTAKVSIEIIERVYMNSPGSGVPPDQAAQPHLKLIGAFQKLNPKSR